MNGRDLYRLRNALHMGLDEFARALGYVGSLENEERRITRLERSDDPLPADVEARIGLFEARMKAFGDDWDK